MHSSLTSSFASAAAGGNVESSANRRDGTGGNEWSRNRSNGATQTFRRSSQATAAQSRDNLQTAATSSTSGPYIPPHINQPQSAARNGISSEVRYTKDQLLSIYQNQRENGTLNRNLHDLFHGPWSVTSRESYSSGRGDGKEQNIGPDVCWNADIDGDPFGLRDMSDAEKHLFSVSVNSPLKLNQTKEPAVASVRKSSLSNHHGNIHNASSSTTIRPGTRRRETTDSSLTNGPLSPSTESKSLLRSEPHTSTPPPALLRRRTDYRDDEIKEENREGDSAGVEGQTPFGSLRRLATGPLSAGLIGPPANPWSSSGPRSAFESLGGFGSFATGTSPSTHDQEKRPGFGSARGNSRFKDLLQRTSTEDMSPMVKERPSINALEKLPEEEGHGTQSRLKDVFRTRPNRSETNPYDDTLARSGSAAISNDGQGIEQVGFSGFNQGEGASETTPATRRVHDALSPTNTNPYHSPAAHRNDDDPGDDQNILSEGPHQFAAGRRDMFSGVSPPSGFGGPRPGAGNVSSLQGWGNAGFGAGNPGRDRNTVSSAFGDPIFSPMGEIQSPGGGFFGSAGFGSAGRSSRLGALFPPAMQDQMRSDSRNDNFEAVPENTGGRDPFDNSSRRPEGFRSIFDENSTRTHEPHYNPQPGVSTPTAPGAPQRSSVGPEQGSGSGPSQSGGSSSSNNLPAAQQRQMVMPDRMRWIYRDPQGNVQGPWSGLEMHDWFKAGFFTAELQVKKLEDAEYEPLAQLVRRIGNSREPFLVPQIGVPHGPPSVTQGNQWANNIGSGGAQPPFANSFPSFGTTLTAEQQNALERRKQEEQYLMARQKEHLAQQQMYMKQMQMQPSSSGIHGLQHHSSAHSLQSQPSFGSITSPTGYHPSPMQGPIQPPQPPHTLGQPHQALQHTGREDELPTMLERISLSQRMNVPLGTGSGVPQPESFIPSQQPHHEAGPQSGLQHAELLSHEEHFLGQGGRNERLEEFQDLRRQIDEKEQSMLPLPIGTQRSTEEVIHPAQQMPIGSTASKSVRSSGPENLSLTQQVQRTAAANEKAASQERPIEPPPMSVSPLPAPTPNRNRQHVADQLAAESRSSSQTPVEPTSIAPWAQAELPKGPSLKEIQEAEARRAAEQEALMAAARRAQAEQERVAAAAAAVVVAPAPGLPATSNWATSLSPASPSPGVSVWGSKQPVKPVSANSASKKTLAQIQKEEEVKKQKAAAQAAAQVQSGSPLHTSAVAGKRYAELAGKVASPTAPTTGSSWIAVGSGGKPKTPATVVAAPQGIRTPSAGSVPVVGKVRPVLQTRTTSLTNKNRADEEFLRWAKSQLANELNAGINPDAFIRNLLELPAEKEILREALYASSQTINGDRVSEEWVRRRKLADKGIIEPVADLNSPVSSDTRNAGWSEVAKKNPAKEELGATQAFKMVPKKKTKK